MNISQAAKVSGLSAKMIRDYENVGLIPPAKRSENGYRRYNENDIALLQFIRRAREVDFSLAETAELLRLLQDPKRTSAAVKAITANHIALLDQKIARLSAMRDTLRGWHAGCCGDQRPECTILEGLLS